MQDELFRWFEREGMLRYRIESDETGDVVEEIRPPVLALGPRDEDWVWPHILPMCTIRGSNWMR
jgi:hypothetical protein